MNDKKTILVVDDTPENIQVLTAALGSLYRVKAATSGEKALKICAGDPMPDLVLLDVLMPEMDGYEVCRRLKSDARTAPIPVVFVTTITDPNEEAKGISLGAVDYISKPIDPAAVLARVASLV
ncbi:MAG: response regulator [Spirochaetes bacterium]|jgi:putative two-component system response regulator|nr:response regulator [Spirochaetota bacterium]